MSFERPFGLGDREWFVIDDPLPPEPRRMPRGRSWRPAPSARRLRRRRAWNYDPEYSRAVNLYGCTPCPRCGSWARCAFVRTPHRIECSDCSYRERRRDRLTRVGQCAHCGGDICVPHEDALTLPAAPSYCSESCQTALVDDMRRLL